MVRFLALILALLSAGMARADAPRVYAAASLAEAVNEIADVYARHRRERPVIVLASSSELARQIAAGAPAGVFVSADEDWMNDLAGKGLVVGSSRVDLLTNALVLVVPAADTRRMTIGYNFDLAGMVGDGRWATGNPDSVPVGRYAKQALIKLQSWDRAKAKIAPAADTRAALAFVEKGAAKAGIVYRTDALASSKVAVAGVFPEWSHARIVYPAALVGAAPIEAKNFLLFLRSKPARTIFRRHGFGMAR